MTECSDGLASANLPATTEALNVADQECLDHTCDEFGLIPILAEAEAKFRTMAEGGDLHALAMVHAAQIVFALMNDVNL